MEAHELKSRLEGAATWMRKHGAPARFPEAADEAVRQADRLRDGIRDELDSPGLVSRTALRKLVDGNG